MDPNVLVEGGAEGLVRIADAFRKGGFQVSSVYLLKLVTPDGDERWTVTLVSEDKRPDLNGAMIRHLVQLEHDGALPRIDSWVRFRAATFDDPEASRVIDYAQQFNRLPVLIRDVMWQGLFIEYALVALAPERETAAA